MSKIAATDKDLKRLDDGNWFRAGGDCICQTCGKKYYDHPQLITQSWINKLCDESLVKL